MNESFLGLAFLAVFSVAGAGCIPANSKCDKAVDNVMAKCGTVFRDVDLVLDAARRDSASCRQALMNMCGTGSFSSSSSSSSSASSPDAFLDCVAYATSCDVILLCK